MNRKFLYKIFKRIRTLAVRKDTKYALENCTWPTTKWTKPQRHKSTWWPNIRLPVYVGTNTKTAAVLLHNTDHHRIKVHNWPLSLLKEPQQSMLNFSCFSIGYYLYPPSLKGANQAGGARSWSGLVSSCTCCRCLYCWLEFCFDLCWYYLWWKNVPVK